MMRFIPFELSQSEKWDEVVRNSDDAWIFHFHFWMTLTQKNWDLESKSFLVEYEGKIVGVFPLQLNRRSRSLRSTYMGLGGPAIINGLQEGVRKKILKGMHEHVRSIAVSCDSPYVEVALNPLSSRCLNDASQINPLIHHYYEDVSTHTWMLDLTRSQQEIFNRYSDDARRSINAAIKLGYSISKVTNISEIDAFYQVHCENREKTGAEIHPKQYFIDVFEQLCSRNLAVIWQAKDAKGVPVAFEVTAFYKLGALYWMGCCLNAHLDSGVTYLLQHHAILWSQSQGAKWYENGEAFPNVKDGKLRGLTLFKGKFGGELRRFYKGRIDFKKSEQADDPLKNWVRSTIALFKPVLREKGVRSLEGVARFFYRAVRSLRSPRMIRFIKPWWGIREFLIGFNVFQDGNTHDIEKMITSLKVALKLQGNIYATSSGRTALEMALRVLKNKFPEKSKVIITTYGCRGVFDPVIHAGFEPIFTDIDEDLGMTIESVRRILKDHEDVAAIVIPQLCGKPRDIKDLLDCAREYGVVTIEDVCQSLGATFHGITLGNRCDMAIFSTGMGKTVAATAGGFLVTRIFLDDFDKEYSNLQKQELQVFRRRFRKMVMKYFLNIDCDFNEEIQNSYRYCQMHPLDARLVEHQLLKLPLILERQRYHARAITTAIHKAGLNVHLQAQEDHTYCKYTLVFKDESTCQRIHQLFHKSAIETEEMYVPLHTRDLSRNFPRVQKLPFAEKIYPVVFNVPVRPNLSLRELQRIISAINHG